jgi:acyl-CoA thioester hydrolase
MRNQFKLWIPITVRWGDMDAMGHVNNAKYFTYCESARISYFYAVELWKHREHDRQGPALVTANLNFRQQVHYPADLEVGVRCSEIRNRSFTLEYEIYRQGTDECVADGASVVVWTDYAANKAIPLPEGLKTAIRQLEGEGLSDQR